MKAETILRKFLFNEFKIFIKDLSTDVNKNIKIQSFAQELTDKINLILNIENIEIYCYFGNLIFIAFNNNHYSIIIQLFD